MDKKYKPGDPALGQRIDMIAIILHNGKGGKSLSPVVVKLLFMAILLAMALPCIAWSEEETPTKIVEVMGTGAVHAKDIAKARDQAISNSLISAVEMVTADILSTESMVQNFQTLNEILYSRTWKFVRNYRILAEATSGNIYTVMIQATVLVDRIENELLGAGIMIGKRVMPRVLFFIAEQSAGDVSPRYWWGGDTALGKTVAEGAMTERMKRKGFPVIAYETMVYDAGVEIADHRLDLDNQEAVNIGTKLQADVVIIGRSMVDIAPRIMGTDVSSFKGTVAVRALLTDTGAEIASIIQTAVTVNTDEVAGGKAALVAAGSIAGEELARQIAVAWKEEAKRLTMVEIDVEGTSNLANFVMFRRTLNDISGVEGMQIREIEFDEAAIVVDYKGDASELADALMLKAFESFSINIYEISQDRLKVELVP